MRTLTYIGVLVLSVASLQAQPDGPTVNSRRDLPVQDLLNMKGTDREAPLSRVTIEQRLNSQLPLDAMFADETGQRRALGTYFGTKPVVLALVYYECPMLCTQILNGFGRASRLLKLQAGKDYEVVAISFDARETPAQAAAKKAVYLKSYGKPENAAGWHFLTGDLNSIKRVTEAVGFKFVWDVHTAQFAHASAIYVLTPEARLSRYFFGVEYSPRELRLALVEASNNKIGDLTDQILLYCYHFDPQGAKYTFVAMGLLRVAGAATALALGGFVFIMLRRESRQKGSRTV